MGAMIECSGRWRGLAPLLALVAISCATIGCQPRQFADLPALVDVAPRAVGVGDSIEVRGGGLPRGEGAHAGERSGSARTCGGLGWLRLGVPGALGRSPLV